MIWRSTTIITPKEDYDNVAFPQKRTMTLWHLHSSICTITLVCMYAWVYLKEKKKRRVCIPAVAETNCLHLLWCSQKRPINLWRMLFSMDSFSDSACESSPNNFLIHGVQYLKKPWKCQARNKIKNSWDIKPKLMCC